jgi:hypothetical protein
MIKIKGNEKGDYVPNYQKVKKGNGSSEESSSLDSSSSSDAEEISSPTPKFKVGDRVKFRRNPNDNAICRTGTITNIKSTRPDPIRTWGDCKNTSIRDHPSSFRYEIATLHEPEPRVWTRSYEFCNEELIRRLKFGEKLEHEDTLHGLQRDERDEAYQFNSLNRTSDKNDMKPVKKPINLEEKLQNPK